MDGHLVRWSGLSQNGLSQNWFESKWFETVFESKWSLRRSLSQCWCSNIIRPRRGAILLPLRTEPILYIPPILIPLRTEPILYTSHPSSTTDGAHPIYLPSLLPLQTEPILFNNRTWGPGHGPFGPAPWALGLGPGPYRALAPSLVPGSGG